MPSSLSDEVAFISNVNADGTLALYSYGAWNPGTIPADYSGGYTIGMKWGGNTAGTPGGTVYYYFNPASNWTSTEQSFFTAGLALWSDIANISFVLTTNPALAQIKFTRGSNGNADTSPQVVDTSPNKTGGQTGGTYLLHMTGATVSIDTSTAGFGPISNFSTYGGYPITTLVHEEGHAIGLGHAGPYNDTVNSATQQFGPYDTRLWSVMSYIEPRTKTAAYYSQYPVTGTNWNGNEPTTWMPLDILAAQALYGLPTSTPLSGGQTFGFNCNVQGPSEIFFDFTKNTTPVITIWDMGTNNTLDLSGFSTASSVNLNAGSFSSCDGMTNNLAIAFNTAIDKVVCGMGNDVIVGNNDGDTLIGGGGNDVITGGSGNDTISASGNSTVDGGGGINTFVVNALYSAGDITPLGSAIQVFGVTLTNIQFVQFQNQTIQISNGAAVLANTTANDFNGDGDADFLWQNDSGQVALWFMNGLSMSSGAAISNNPGPSWHVKGAGDFDGDGKSDILWQNDSGQVAIWLMNGSTITAGAVISNNPGTSWHVIGSGDFNGDGKADILWQNDSGQAAIWLMNGTSFASGALIGANPGPSWHLKAAADFNGDGKADMLWQNDNGQVAIWLMDGTTELAGPLVGNNPGPAWHVKAAGDFNGDGKADILWQNDNGQAVIWLMDGATVLSGAAVGSNPGPSWQVTGASDVNGDGMADILWQNTNGQAAAWLMSGTNVLGTATIGPNPGTSWHLIAASS